MRTWLWLLKARTLLLCSALVVIVGLAPVLYLIGLVAWQLDMRLETGSWIALPAALLFTDRALLLGGNAAPVLAFVPYLDLPWTPNELGAQVLKILHVGLVPGLLGCAIVAAGISGVLRQRMLIRIHKQRKKNPVQPSEPTAAAASSAHGRSEPFIGAPEVAPSAANDTAAPLRVEPGLPGAADRQAPVCPRRRGRPMKRRVAA